jgi:hypothetical protein
MVETLVQARLMGADFNQDWFVLNVENAMSYHGSYSVLARGFESQIEAQQAAEQAERDAAQSKLSPQPLAHEAQNPPSVSEELAAEPDDSTALPPSGYVAIVGQTYPMRVRIKAVAADANEPIEFFDLDKKALRRKPIASQQLPSRLPNSQIEHLLAGKVAWLTTQKVFDTLVAQYPNECKQYNIIAKLI